MAKNRRTPRPFKYRGRWRAQVTLSNGTRPHADFDTMQEAKYHAMTILGLANSRMKAKAQPSPIGLFALRVCTRLLGKS